MQKNKIIKYTNMQKIKLMKNDFRKIDQTGKISMLFNAIPAELNKNASRYQISSVMKGKRANSVLEQIAEMQASKTVNVAYHANDPNVGMSNHKDLTRFKLYIADTGLFTTLIFQDRDFTENIIYEKLFSDQLGANLGYLYENVMAQMLIAKGYELFYYTWMNQSTRHNYEIDFIITKQNKICPIEVKSSGYKTHASLDEFCEKYNSRIREKYLVYTKDLNKDQDVWMLPMYLAPFL